MNISISTPRNFNFRRTVLSHGWYALPPFELNEANWTLIRVLDLGSAKPVSVRIAATKRALQVQTSRRLGKQFAEKIVHDIRHMLRLDDDMSHFYEVMSQQPDFAWIAAQGAGRLLRSPTVFEDLVKMICTTNCSWALTEKMVKNLVSELGREADDGRKSFPAAEVMAEKSEKFYRDKIRAGYRAPYLRELAERVASNDLAVEKWLHLDVPHDQFMKELKRVKGVGNYAAENLLKLLGRYDGLALDSWTRAQFAKLRNNGRSASDKKIARFYSQFNSWRGLALWCDMTRQWLNQDRIGEW